MFSFLALVHWLRRVALCWMNVKYRHTGLVLGLRNSSISSFTTNYNINCRILFLVCFVLFYTCYLSWGHSLLLLAFWEFSPRMGFELNCICFFCIYWYDPVFLLQSVFEMMDYTDWFSNPWNKPTLVMVNNYFYILLNSFGNLLLRIWTSIFMGNISL